LAKKGGAQTRKGGGVHLGEFGHKKNPEKKFKRKEPGEGCHGKPHQPWSGGKKKKKKKKNPRGGWGNAGTRKIRVGAVGRTFIRTKKRRINLAMKRETRLKGEKNAGGGKTKS